MPLFFTELLPGSGTHLSQETRTTLVYRSESCKRRLRMTAPCGPPGMATQIAEHVADATCIPPSLAGPPSCPLHLSYQLNLMFVIGIPNTCMCCILEFRVNQYCVCNFLKNYTKKFRSRMPRLHRRKPIVLKFTKYVDPNTDCLLVIPRYLAD